MNDEIQFNLIMFTLGFVCGSMLVGIITTHYNCSYISSNKNKEPETNIVTQVNTNNSGNEAVYFMMGHLLGSFGK